MPVGLAPPGALGLDRQAAVSHGDLDVVGGVDAGKLGADFVDPVFHLVFQAHRAAVEERPQARERRETGEELGELGKQWARLALDGKLIHDSSRIYFARGT